MARCFAVAMSQPPGFSGMPESGRRSSAATSASCASSSARPRSRTRRVRPAMSFACSIRQTASIARWTSGAATVWDQTGFTPPVQGTQRPVGSRLAGLTNMGGEIGGAVLCRLDNLVGAIRHLVHLADFDHLSVPGGETRHLDTLELFDHPAARGGAALRPFDRLFLRLHLDQPEAADHLLRLGEWSVGHDALTALECHARALRCRMEPLERQQRAGL